MAQLDLRYRVARKNYFTARAGVFYDNYDVKDFIHQYPFHAFGVEYARQTLVGPLRVAAQWCNVTGFTAYAGIGFDF